MARFEWIFFEKVWPRLKIIIPVTIIFFIVGTVIYWYVDRDVVAEGCTYIVAATDEELKAGELMPVRPEDGDIYITPEGTYEFNRWPTCHCSYGRSHWNGAPNASNRLTMIAGRPVE